MPANSIKDFLYLVKRCGKTQRIFYKPLCYYGGMTDMAGRLRELRGWRNWNQEAMANRAGVSQVTWSAWERETPKQFTALRRLAEELELSSDYLLGLTDDPTPLTRRAEWTPEAIALVNLFNELPTARRNAALSAFRGVIELTTSEIDAQKALELEVAKQRALLLLLKGALTADKYERIQRLVEAGDLFTDAELRSFLDASDHDIPPNGFKLLGDDNLLDESGEG